MSRQNVIIIDFKTLYEILHEINDKLSFNLINYDNEEVFIKNPKVDLENSLIITRTTNNKIFPVKNLLNFDNFPVPLNKLIELINIQLLKLKFNYQSKINIKDYELDLNSKFFSKKSINLKLTEKEIEIILYLNLKKDKHNVLDLQKNIWGYANDLETHTVETHIYRLRKKINDKFGDKNFILSHDDGYYIK